MPTFSSQLRAVAGWGVCLVGLLLAGTVRGEDYRQGFDDLTPNWIVHYDKSEVTVLRQSGQSEHRVKGERAEVLTLQSTAQTATLQLEHELPAARAIEELKLQVWVKANYRGAGLFLRVVFPNQIDPRTGKALSTFLRGDSYKKPGEWQKLECGTTTKALQERARQLRSSLGNPQLDFSEAYVDRAIITCKVSAGRTEFFLDELQLGPVVSPASVGSRTQPNIQKTGGTTSPVQRAAEDQPKPDPQVEFQLDRLLVGGRPFFPRIAAHHNEPLDSLKLAGLNVVWIQDYENSDMLRALRSQGLWAMATPPRAVTSAGKIIDAEDVSIIPFTDQTEPILLWNLGTRVPQEARDELIGWMKQIQSADRHFHRPVMVDVMGGQERLISKHVPMLGVNRRVLNTSFTPKAFRDWLVQKKKLARPGTFMWTWIQTELAFTDGMPRQPRNSPMVIEPEQIRLLVYAALAAGCRGIAYWKTSSLEDEAPGAFERQLAIAQLNLELELLEPWLATGTVAGQIPFGAVAPKPQHIGQRAIQFRSAPNEIGERRAMLHERENQAKRAAHQAGDLEAAIIRSDYGTLLLPIWYDREAQFVPGQMAANDASIIVPPFDQTASAWEVSPTGIRSLPCQPTTGGKLITLKKFDQTAAIIVTSDRKLIARLHEKIKTLAEPSARVSVALAKAKLERVTRVDAELQTLSGGQPDAPHILAKSRQLVEAAEEALSRRDFDGARQMAADAMQLQRILQRAHWNDAVRKLTSPVSSPHTICFQTLPDYWRMVSRLGPIEMSGNLLRSGNFEDIDTMRVDGWRHSQKSIHGVRAAAELYPEAKEGSYSLRLVAAPVPGKEIPAVMPRRPVTVTTPPVTVESGQVVAVSGWVRVASPITHSLDGAMLYDNLGGPVAALRWQNASGWQRFTVFREVQHSGSFTVTISLAGLGEIQFDDLTITPVNPQTAPALATPNSDPQNPFTKPLKLLQQFPNFRPWSGRN